MDFKEKAKYLIEKYQNNFPIVSRPFLNIAEAESSQEDFIREQFKKIHELNYISRIGPVFATNKVGKSFLAACFCPKDRMDEVVQILNSFEEVNHNYLRENDKLNVWFVMTAENDEALQRKLNEFEEKAKLKAYAFPMVKSYKLDLSLKGDLK